MKEPMKKKLRAYHCGIGKTFVALALCAAMVLSVVSPVAAAQQNTPTQDGFDDSIVLTKSQADSLVANLFGEDVKAVESSEKSGYSYILPDKFYEELLEQVNAEELAEETADETAPSEAASGQEETAQDANAVPSDFVDDSAETLQSILEEARSAPVSLGEGASAAKVDLVFVIDSTGSMHSAISNVKKNVAEFATYLAEKGITLRLGLIDYKDITADGTDSTKVHEVSFSPWLNVSDFIAQLSAISVDGGGDGPETPIDGMGHLVNGTLAWSSDAYKFAMLITDADYKEDNLHGIENMQAMVQRLQEQDIQTSVVTTNFYAPTYANIVALTGGIQANLDDDFSELLKNYADVVIGSAQPTRDYSVVVTERNSGLPVAGATVAWNGGQTVTDALGVATVSTRNEVIRNVSVACDGYTTYRTAELEMSKTQATFVTLTINEDLDEVISGVPVVTKRMFINPKPATDRLNGPKVEILGKKFSAFEFDISWDACILDNVSVSHDAEEKTYSVMIGREFEGKDPKDDPYWKDDYKKYKSLVQLFSKKPAKEIYNDFRTLRKNNKSKADIMLPVDVSVSGYVDFSYASGELKLDEGGVVIAVAIKDKSLPDIPIGAPYIYLKFTFSMDLTGKFVIVTVEEDGKFCYGLDFDSLQLSPGLSATLNLGVPKLATVGGGLNGVLDATISGLPTKGLKDVLTVDATFSLLFKMKLLGWKTEAEFPFKNYRLYPFAGKSATQLNISTSDFSPIAPVNTIAALAENSNTEFTFESQTSADNAPKLLELEAGQWLMVWVNSAPNRKSTDHMAVYYSVFTPQKGWSAATVLADDGTADFAPSLHKLSDGTIVVAWQNSTKKGIDALEEQLQNVEVCAAVFDAEKQEFKAAQSVSQDNQKAKLSVQIADNGDIYWIENDENSILLTAGTTAICKSSFDGEAWNPCVEEVSSIENLNGFTTGTINGKPVAVYAYTTAENTMLVCGDDSFEIASNGTGYQVVDGVLYWSDDDGLHSYNGSGVKDERDKIEADFVVLKNGDKRVILARQLEQDAEDAYVSRLYASVSSHNSQWSGFTPLVSYENALLGEISAVLKDDGSLVWTCEKEDLAGTDASFLLVDQYTPQTNVLVGETAYVPNMDVAANQEIQLSVVLSNQSLADVDGLQARFDGKTVDLTVNEESSGDGVQKLTVLKAGETVEANIPYMVPETVSGNQEVNIEIVDAEGQVLGTTTATISPYANIAVENVSIERKDAEHVSVKAIVANHGAIPAVNTVASVSQQEGEIAVLSDETVTLDTLAPGESKEITFTVDAKTLQAENPYDYKSVEVTLQTETPEWYVADNAKAGLLQPILPDSLKLDKETLTLESGKTQTVTCMLYPAGAVGSVAWMSNNKDVATVGKDGVITALSPGKTTITALETQTGISATLEVVVEGEAAVGVNGVSVTPAQASIRKGETVTLTAEVYPENASNKNVTWKTLSDLVQIEADGHTAVVTGLDVGTAKIIAVTEDGSYIAESEITITQEPETTPQPTATPEPTAAPEPTATPEPTTTPEPAVTSEPTNSPSDSEQLPATGDTALPAVLGVLAIAAAGTAVFLWKRRGAKK